ncbi:MAG: hypothetical protein QW087_01935 [Methanomassiliicoccales archaeon]
MFCVVVCPHCHKPIGIKLLSEKCTCPSCGKRINPKKLNIYFKTESERELVVAVQKLSYQLVADRKSSIDKSLGENEYLLSKTAPAKTPRDESSIVKMIDDLCREKGEFTIDDLSKLIGNVHITEVLIEKLLSEGILYEPRPGYYKKV